MLISELGINVSLGEANVGDVPSPRGWHHCDIRLWRSEECHYLAWLNYSESFRQTESVAVMRIKGRGPDREWIMANVCNHLIRRVSVISMISDSAYHYSHYLHSSSQTSPDMDDNLSNLSHQIVIILLTVHTEENRSLFVLFDFDCVLNLVNSRTVLSP